MLADLSRLRFDDLEFSRSSFSPLAEIGIVISWTFCMLLIHAIYSCTLTLSMMISLWYRLRGNMVIGGKLGPKDVFLSRFNLIISKERKDPCTDRFNSIVINT